MARKIAASRTKDAFYINVFLCLHAHLTTSGFSQIYYLVALSFFYRGDMYTWTCSSDEWLKA